MSAIQPRGSVRTVRDLCELIWSVEREFNLLDLDVNGVKIWQYTRMEIYYYLAELSGVFIEAHPIKRNTRSLLAKLPRLLKELVVESPLWLVCRKVDEVVIEHPRSAIFEGERVDIYTHAYRESMRRSGKKVVSLNRLVPGAALKSADHNRYSLACLPLLLLAWRRIKHARLSADALTCINRVSVRLSSELGCEVSLEPILSRSIGKFKLYTAFYRWLFNSIKPKKLTVVIGYACGDAIFAAKQLGIETAEIQHGTFSAYHLGYSYPACGTSVELFPDKLMVWGEYWKEAADLPIPESNVTQLGFDYYLNKISKLPAVAKRSDYIVVISQGALGDKVAACVYDYFRNLYGYKIFYKLHPSEYLRWRTYPQLEALSQRDDFEVVTDQYDLYALLNEASMQVGVFSTALYEGLALGCKTALLDLPGVEYMSHLIESGRVALVAGEEDFMSFLNKKINPNSNASDFFGANTCREKLRSGVV